MIETQCEAAATAFLSAIALNPHAHAMDAEGKKHASANTVKRGRNWGCDPCIPVRWQQQRQVGIETRSRPRQDPRRRGHCVGVERKNHASANTITRQQCHQENALHCGQIEQQAAQSVLLQHVRGGRPAGQWDLVGAYDVAGHVCGRLDGTWLAFQAAVATSESRSCIWCYWCQVGAHCRENCVCEMPSLPDCVG